jgi:DNA-binding transcriptional LysR family regulator
MQPLDWNDLRHILAVGRAGSLGGAARQLGVDPTTVARRLAAASRALDVPLFERAGEGRLRPTEAGTRAIHHAEAVEAAIGDLGAAVAGNAAAVSGTVRLTAVPLLANRLLAPASAALTLRHPALRLELVAEPRELSLTRREADMALRLARPDRAAGDRILARRMGSLDYAAYAAADASCPETLPWLGYDDTLARLPQAAWIAEAVRRGEPLAAVAFNDAEAMLHAAGAGLGRALLPRLVADRVPTLRRLEVDRPMPAREIWLLSHPEQRRLPRIAAVADWLASILSG